jgi:hypothetical protein
MTKLRILIGVSAIAAVGLTGIGAAYADGPGGTIPNTFFTQLPGVAPTTPVRKVPAIGTVPGQGPQAYVTHSNNGTSVFPPHDGASH